MDDERTYSKSEIRERRRELSQLVALQQRQLAALAKMDEAAEELDQVEREMAALARRGNEPEQCADASVAALGDAPAEPEMTGERAVTVMREDHPDEWCDGRGILEGFAMRGWIGDRDPELVIQSLRHSLRRLALRDPRVERKTEAGGRHFYRYTPPAISVEINGVPHPALQGGHADG